MLRVRLTKRTVFLHSLLPILLAVYLSWMPFSEPILNEVSLEYLRFSEAYPLGYPVFLNVIELFSLNRMWVVHAQIWFFAFSVFYLSLSIFKNTNNNLHSLLISLPILFNPYSLSVHYAILPQSLFLSFSLLALAFFISSFGRCWVLNLAGFGFSIACCILLEANGWAYLILLLFAAPLIARKNNCSFAKVFFIPAVVCTLFVTIESTTHSAVHERSTDKPHAPHVFFGAALMDTTQDSPYAEKDPRTVIWSLIETELANVRAEIWQTASFDDRLSLLNYHKQLIKNGFAQQEISQAAQLLEKSENEIRMDIANARIIQDPLAFLKITWDHYRALWHVDYRLTYPLWIISVLTLLIGLWCLLSGVKFNPMFALAFICACALQSQTLWIAHVGIGPAHIVTQLGSLLSTLFIALLIGFYIAVVSPLRNDA
ncbi:hypothetical protein [Terasakiella pusilla]|uniref:hypothetical protein n=1 Tax=Terasakiella pusilla TaxID=64973 RepID=UPI003AA7EF5E